MPGMRTGFSWAFVVVALLAATLVVPMPVAPAQASDGFTPENIVFPVAGPATFVNDFGDPRSGGRTHAGIDLMTRGKGVPIIAAAAGTVSWIGAGCCSMAIDHGDGWSTWYVHLDNDTPGTDDGLGWGIADGLVRGSAVARGQLIGWSGDSGNAEDTPPHLHFEIRRDGVAINPYRFVLAAPRLDHPAGSTGVGFFVDDNGNVHEANINEMYRRGITRGCNPPANDRYCPNDKVTRGHIAAFLRRYLELPASTQDHFTDDTGHIFEADIDALAAAGIAFGCGDGRFCPNEPLRREEMAELLVRTFAPADPGRFTVSGAGRFTDAGSSPFVESIMRLGAAGIAIGCNPPANDAFCPSHAMNRAQMATFMVRALSP